MKAWCIEVGKLATKTCDICDRHFPAKMPMLSLVFEDTVVRRICPDCLAEMAVKMIRTHKAEELTAPCACGESTLYGNPPLCWRCDGLFYWTPIRWGQDLETVRPCPRRCSK